MGYYGFAKIGNDNIRSIMSSTLAKEETLGMVSVSSANDLKLSHEETIHLTKNRIVAVDIVRLLAAFIVMIIHLLPFYCDGLYGNDGHHVYKTIIESIAHFYPVPSSLFFVLAGYFACRNITWKKALKNAWWSLIPLVLWCGITLVGGNLLNTSFAQADTSSWLNVLGVNQFFIDSWILNPEGKSAPVDFPLWFMRDLIFLFLLSPILHRWAKYLFPAMLLLSLAPTTRILFNHNPYITCSLYSIFFFMGGCFLRHLSKESQTKALQFCNIWIILGYFLLRLLIWKGYITFAPIAYLDMLGSDLTPPIPVLISVWILYQIARWLELHVRFSKDFALKYAPVTFLTFAAHVLIYRALEKLLPKGDSIIPMLLPFACFILLSVFFFAMKRWCRPLLHPVAHYVLRPDDLKPKQNK